MLTQELRCLLFWGLFSRCVFRHLSWPGRTHLLDKRQELLQHPELEIYHDDILPRQVWTLPRYFHLRSLYSAPLLPFEESLLCPATSTWGIFTLPRYFHLRTFTLTRYESLLWPATFSWGIFTLTRYFHLRSVYSDPLLPLEEFSLTRYFHLRSSCPFKDANRIHITPDIRCWETWINSLIFPCILALFTHILVVVCMFLSVFVSLFLSGVCACHCLCLFLSLVCAPRREAGDVWCFPPVWNLRAVIWFPFPISSLVFSA